MHAQEVAEAFAGHDALRLFGETLDRLLDLIALIAVPLPAGAQTTRLLFDLGLLHSRCFLRFSGHVSRWSPCP
jgi:hypothetical protein